MNIAVVIPTLDRRESLKQTLKSLAGSEHRDFNVIVVVDGDESYYQAISSLAAHWLIILHNKERIGWGKSINLVCNITDYDAYFSGSDDLQFFPDTLGEAAAAMERKFPDLDGVIGINQDLQTFCPAAMNLTGRMFINRFPKRKLYNPIYDHFCVDSELWHYAQHQQKFHFCKRSRVIHRRYNDPCHRLAQKTLGKDRQIWWAKKGRPGTYWPNMKAAPGKNKKVLRSNDPWE
jgi:glycosyltransferase involved in cell wall biosynthesis